MIKYLAEHEILLRFNKKKQKHYSRKSLKNIKTIVVSWIKEQKNNNN